jgi:hypothetical protein
MNRKFIDSKDGVVGIVVAVLLIGLMVSVVSLVQLVYVPNWMEQREAEHMDEVATQFSQLKFAIDTLNANKQNYTTIATSITLGSKELPYWMSLRAFGNLEILSDEFRITINNVSSSSQFSIGTIKYSSSNGYFIDQDFIYEGGAIITNQADGNIISIKPSFPSIKKVGNKLFLTANLINISGSYSWYIFMNWTLENQGLIPGALGGDFYITPNYNNNSITIDFFSSNIEGYPTINLSIIEILAQIGPGWID